MNRFCSAGLEAISISALRVMSGWADVTIGGGLVEAAVIETAGDVFKAEGAVLRTFDLKLSGAARNSMF